MAPILDSILGGTSTLMHQAYLRRVAQRQYEYELAKLQQEGELRRATMEMTGAYHQAMIGAAQQRIAAKPAQETKANQKAYGTLKQVAPDHSMVAPDENGIAQPFDDTKDYKTPLADVLRQQEAHNRIQQQTQGRLDYLEKAQTGRVELAGLREKWKKEDAKSGATASPAQNRLRANDFLARIGAQFQGNYEQMAAFIGSDPEASRDAQTLGVTDYAIRGTASQITGKASATATRQNIDMARSGMFTDPSKGSLPTPEDINKARTGLTVTAPPAARPTAPALPNPLAPPPAAWPPKPDETAPPPAASTARGTVPPAPIAAAPSPATTAPAPTTLPAKLISPAAANGAAAPTRPNLLMTPATSWPPQKPEAMPDLAPAAAVTPLAKPQVPFQAQGVPPGPPPPSSVRQMVQLFDANRQPLGEPYEVDAQGKRVVPPAVPGGLKPAWKPGQPVDENTLSDADLWEHRRAMGLTPDAATAYVKARKATPAAPPKPEDEQEPF